MDWGKTDSFQRSLELSPALEQRVEVLELRPDYGVDIIANSQAELS